MTISKRVRQYIGLFSAILLYYLIHEGAHYLVAVCYGVFQEIRFLGIGVQVVVLADAMTDTQLAILCLAGAGAALTAGWILVLLCKKICMVKAKLFKTILWYTSICLLLLDPVYLSILYPLFGGGDMNGIRLILPETPARIGFAMLGVLGGIAIWKYLLPQYTHAFAENEE